MAVLIECSPQTEPQPAPTVVGSEAGIISVIVDSSSQPRISEPGSLCETHAVAYEELKEVLTSVAGDPWRRLRHLLCRL